MRPLFDLANPSQLMSALTPDLILMVGSMVLLLVAVWRRESREHQRVVGYLSIGLCAVTMIAVYSMMNHVAGELRGHPGMLGASDGPIAVDNFRWMADLVILL